MRQKTLPGFLFVGILAVSVIVAGWIGDVLRIEAAARDETTLAGPTIPALEARPLPLRLVDAGSVGILPDTTSWGGDYSHNQSAFRDLLLTEPPFVSPTALVRIEHEWDDYLDLMTAYGNNGIVTGAFLELINFDRVGDGHAVYDEGSRFRPRHLAWRRAFRDLFQHAADRDVGVYLKTDMLAVTDPLADYLRRSPAGLDTANPALWDVYRAGLEELFAELPMVAGLVIRIGEAGPLYERGAWDYRSELLVRDPRALRTMLAELLPVFEAHDKTLILRSWTIGVGELGNLHLDPSLYAQVLGDIDSPNLVVSTKFVAGDYFSHLPLNPTLMGGPHRRLIEFQARREYEGFSAFPNYLGRAHQRALQHFLAANPRIEGTYLWTQEGGPLRAGPLSLYPLHGFWLWIDANVYATSQLALDPTQDLDDVTDRWLAQRFGDHPEAVAPMRHLLELSRQVVEQGLYIEPYARQRVTLSGVEVPPLLWIMEWDVVGGWDAVLGTVYASCRDELDAAIAGGFAAVDCLREMSADLERAAPHLAADVRIVTEMRRSLAYEESLLTTLAWYRAAFLHYYAWLESGRSVYLAKWRDARAHFAQAAAHHNQTYRADLGFPAFDFTTASAGIDRVPRGIAATRLARFLLGTLILLMTAGALLGRRRGRNWPAALARAIWIGAVAPWRLERFVGRLGPSAIGLLLFIAIFCGLTLAAFSGFASLAFVVSGLVMLGVFAVALKANWSGIAPSPRDGAVPVALAPLLLVSVLLLSVISVRGPQYFWFHFWTSDWFRVAFLTLWLALAFWTAIGILIAGTRTNGGRVSVAAGGLLVSLGVASVLLSVLLPGFAATLSALDTRFGVVPMTHSVLLTLTEHLDVSEHLTRLPAFVGVVAIGSGMLVRWARPLR